MDCRYAARFGMGLGVHGGWDFGCDWVVGLGRVRASENKRHLMRIDRLPGPRAIIPARGQTSCAPPPYRGATGAEITERRDALQSLGDYPISHRVCLAPAFRGLRQIPLFDENTLNSEIIKQHYDSSLSPEVNVYGLTEHELGGVGFLQSNGGVFMAPDVVPKYFNYRFPSEVEWRAKGGSLFNPDAALVDVDGPVATVLHPNLVYGHFLLEIFPKLHLLSRLRASGLVFPLAVPEATHPWIRAIIALYFEDSEIITYDSDQTRLRAPCFIAPSMMQVGYQFHPEFNAAIEEIKRHVLHYMKPEPKPRIWLSRRTSTGKPRLLNEPEVEETMIALWFDVVHPHEMSFPEQIALFDGAECVVAEFGSAVHNTLFSRRGTKVLCLNRINWYQSGIGSLRSLHVAYMPPADGRFRDWRSQHTPDAEFTINCRELRESVQRFMDS